MFHFNLCISFEKSVDGEMLKLRALDPDWHLIALNIKHQFFPFFFFLVWNILKSGKMDVSKSSWWLFSFLLVKKVWHDWDFMTEITLFCSTTRDKRGGGWYMFQMKPLFCLYLTFPLYLHYHSALLSLYITLCSIIQWSQDEIDNSPFLFTPITLLLLI